MNIEQIKQLQRRISPNHVTEAQVVLPLLTCSDLRSCQVYGSKNLANIEGVEHESVVEFGGGGVKYGRWCPLSVQLYVIFTCMVFC